MDPSTIQIDWRPDPAWERYSSAAGSALPEGLETMPAGPELASILAGIDRSSLSGYDRITVLQARNRLRSHLDAELAADMAGVIEAVSDVVGDDEAFPAAASEIRAALRFTRRAADSWLHLASELFFRLPSVWDALHRGAIDLSKARVICEGVASLDPAVASRVAEQVLDLAPTSTTGQIRARLARLVIDEDPLGARHRLEHRLSERRVHASPTPDGTANLYGLDMDPVGVARVMRRINRIARRLHTRDETRTLDQLRADVLLDLLSGGGAIDGSRVRGVVDISVDLTTLAGLDDKSAEIPGWGPILADLARRHVEEQDDARWQITVTDPDGKPLAVTTTRRRPTAAQRRLAQARSPICVFPGCRMPAVACDLDHSDPWAETHRTDTDQLGTLCRHDHVNRHRRGWSLSQTRPGVFRWTSPLGHTYTSGPDPP